MDNAIVNTHEVDAHEVHEHVSLPQHRHHFETEEQQREAGSFGMWLFLLTEIMFFGGMFFAYLSGYVSRIRGSYRVAIRHASPHALSGAPATHSHTHPGSRSEWW